MPLPDPYANETTTELDPVTFSQYMEATDAVSKWQQEANRLKAMLIEQLGDAHAGLVDGRKLVYYRPTDRWAEARMIKENPDLTQHYIRPKVIDVFDLDAFSSSHPEIVDRYRVRSFRSVGDV